MKPIGSTFASELETAGLHGLPFSWEASGALNFGPGMTPQQKDAVLAVHAAHDAQRSAVPKEVPVKHACVILARHVHEPTQKTYLQIVEDYLEAMTGQEGVEARIEWKRCKVVQRNHPLTLILKGVIGLTDAQVDALFVEAAALDV